MMRRTLAKLSLSAASRNTSKKRGMLILSEADVRECLPIERAIEANRRALGSLRKAGDGGATVPTRIGLPYRGEVGDCGASTAISTSSEVAEDWTLFKPAMYEPTNDTSNNGGNRTSLMGLKLVSVRGGNPSMGLPTVPATVMLVDCKTGIVSALMGGTYLTAARTAAGSAIATDCMTDVNRPLHLLVFGAGLQAEMHIDAIRSIRNIGRISIVNRSSGRAEQLIALTREKMKESEQEVELDMILLQDRCSVKDVVGRADIICTTTNTTTPLFDGSWVKQRCHLNGVGSYTAHMEEIPSTFCATRCQVVIDTPEAINVGDLKCISVESENYVGLLGDVLAGNVDLGLHAHELSPNLEKGRSNRYDCSMFKSVGTAIQDVVTAHEVYQEAIKRGVGMEVEM
jgi:ornithine cyclodeaminase